VVGVSLVRLQWIVGVLVSCGGAGRWSSGLDLARVLWEERANERVREQVLTTGSQSEARTETRPGQFGLIWLHPTSVSSAPPSTDSKTTTRTATSPVSYHSPISTRDARRME